MGEHRQMKEYARADRRAAEPEDGRSFSDDPYMLHAAPIPRRPSL
jgi:hypothetical protein